MVRIRALSATFCREPEQPGIVDQLARFRKQLFVDHCGWGLEVKEGRERDEFDNDRCVHCALYADGELVGGFRAISTDNPYLAQKLLTDLVELNRLPQRPDFWEISRFGVLPNKACKQLSLINYALMFSFARQIRATALVAVADLAHERFLKTIGVRTRRYGPPQPIGRDRRGRHIRAVAGDIPIAAQNGTKFDDLLNAIDDVEINDASLVFRPTSISA